MSLTPVIGTFVTLFGLILGSAMTALAWRLAHGESWVRGRSRCPACGHVLAARDLVPVLSWALARGRCRHCGVRVSARYPLIELACGAWALLAWSRLGLGLPWLLTALWGVLLVALAAVDLDVQLLPDALTLPGTLIAVAAALLGPGARHAAIGMTVGAGYLWLVGWIWTTFLKREGMGGGDVKLAAMFGALLGGAGAFLTISLAALLGSIAGAVLLARGRGTLRTALPFGAFLCPSALIAWGWGQRWIDAYVALLRR